MSLGRAGINAFAHHHRAYVEAIKAAAGKGWKLLIVTAELTHTQQIRGYYEEVINSKKTALMKVFNEEGNDVTEAEKWLKDVLDFDSAMDGDSDTGMVLDSEYFEDNWWGECKNTEKKNRTITEQYRASFLLVSSGYCLYCVHTPFLTHIIVLFTRNF